MLSMLLATTCVLPCVAQPVPSTWPVECAGRLAVNLPGPADVASMTFDQFLSNSEEHSYQFDDGEPAFYSHFQYGGHVAITGPLTKGQSATLIADQRMGFEAIKQSIATGRKLAGNGTKLNIDTLDTADAGHGWKMFNASEITYAAYPQVPGHAVSWILAGTAEDGADIRKYLRTFQTGARPRATQSVPAERGVCMPHLFIRDGGDDSARRLVAATYRLRAHPDVTVMLKDATATGVPSNSSEEKYSAIYQSNFFWTQDYQQAKSVKSLLNGSHNKVTLAGQNAVETMFRIERRDHSEDFGYLVVARAVIVNKDVA